MRVLLEILAPLAVDNEDKFVANGRVVCAIVNSLRGWILLLQRSFQRNTG